MSANSVRAALAAALLASLIAVLAACGQEGAGQTGKNKEELVDNGPNAGLSNEELVSVAITNMKALKSYHFDFMGGAPGMDVRMSSNLSITGDVQLYGMGARWKVRDEGGGVFGGVGGMNYDVGQGIDGIRATRGHWYESYDGGKTWELPKSGDTQLSFLLLWLDCRWGDLFEERATTGDPTICEAMARNVDFNDGTPRLEKIDGAVTRHMVGVYGDQQAQASGQALTVDIWVSTDITPTLRQMRIQGSNKLYENVVEMVNDIAFSPDGKTLAAAHGWALDGTIRLYDVNSPGAPQRKLTNALPYFEAVDFSPDGAVIVGRGPTGICVWDLTRQDSTPITPTIPEDVSSFAFQPNGTLLAAASHNGVYLLNPRDLNSVPKVLPVPTNVSLGEMAFSPDGQTLAARTWESGTLIGTLIYDMRHPEQDPVLTQDERPEYEWNEKVADDSTRSPDGQLVASADYGHIDVWDPQQPQTPIATLPAKSGRVSSAVFSPDGKYLVILGENRQVEFWDVELLTGPTAAHSPAIKLDTGEELTTDLAFSPDGKRLAVSTDDGSVLVWKTDDVLNREAAKPQIFKEEEVLIDKPFSLTWDWSRFNGDFGEVQPPPADAIKQP